MVENNFERKTIFVSLFYLVLVVKSARAPLPEAPFFSDRFPSIKTQLMSNNYSNNQLKDEFPLKCAAITTEGTSFGLNLQL